MSNKNKTIEFVSDNMAVLPAHGLIVAITGGGDISPNTPKPRSPKEKSEHSVGTIAYWGEDNQFPQDVICRAKKDLGLLSLLDKKSRLLQGREVIAVQMVYNSEKRDFDTVRINDLEINEFLADSIFQRYWREACVDFTWYHNIFPDLIKDVEKENIPYIGTHDASHCRWSLQNNKGVIHYFAHIKSKSKLDAVEEGKINCHKNFECYHYKIISGRVVREVGPRIYQTVFDLEIF